MKKHFYKMNGSGNDFILFDGTEEAVSITGERAKELCDRRKIGADGVIVLEKSATADVKMTLFNSDGSTGKTCGNGLRCVGAYLSEKTEKTAFSVETESGIRRVEIAKRGRETVVTVDMGKADFSPESLPTLIPTDGNRKIIERKVSFSGEFLPITCVSMGNPHAVLFEKNLFAFERHTEKIANSELFPDGVNVEIAKAEEKNRFVVRVNERGCGETLACGSGACAVAVAGVETGRAEKNAEIVVVMRGGTLFVKVTDESVFLTGEAQTDFVGETEI